MHLMTWNNKTYIQEVSGQVTDLGAMIQDLGPLNHYYTPPAYSGQSKLCKDCNTTTPAKYIKEGHCPYCGHLI
jgi:uncharacterized paraquat-inducible protein A